jgi:hypothetical protein
MELNDTMEDLRIQKDVFCSCVQHFVWLCVMLAELENDNHDDWRAYKIQEGICP